MTKHGPNFMELVHHKVSRDAIPPGGGIADGIDFFSDPTLMKAVMKSAIAWVEEVMVVMKSAPDNPYGDDDESLAAVILEQLESKLGN